MKKEISKKTKKKSEDEEDISDPSSEDDLSDSNEEQFCRSCGGVGCDKCGYSGIEVDPELKEIEDFEKQFDE